MKKTETQDKKARIAEIEKQMETLYLEQERLRKELMDAEISPKLNRILNKWVKIPGWCTIDENKDNKETISFRLAKVTDIAIWHGGVTASLKLENLVYIGGPDTRNNSKFDVLIANKDDMKAHTVNNIDNITVIPAKKAMAIVRSAHKTVSRELDKVLKAAWTDSVKES